MAEIAAIGARESRTAAGAASAVSDTKASFRALPHDRVSRGSRSGELTPSQQFESFVLQGFVEQMLPKGESGYFGEGTAGTIWRSMLAERIGAEMAAVGGVGIADMVEKRNASIEGIERAREELRRDDVAAKGAALSKPGAL